VIDVFSSPTSVPISWHSHCLSWSLW